MSDELSFNLFGRDGVINPTPWGRGPNPELGRFGVPFYDQSSGEFYEKQTAHFDGGWRWYESLMASALCIYNVKLDARAFHDLTHMELEDSLLQPETLLNCAKSHVLVEHIYYTNREQLLDHIRALAMQASIAITKEICGDKRAQPHLRPVRV